MYHASRQRFASFHAYAHLTPDADAAIGYLQGDAGYLYEVEVGDLRLADEDDVRRVAREIDPDHPWMYTWEMIEEMGRAVRNALQSEGWDGVAYRDLGPDNAYEHETVLVWSLDAIRIVSVEEVA